MKKKIAARPEAAGRDLDLAEGLMSVKDAGSFVGLGRSKLHELMAAGELAYVKIGRARRIPRAALIALARANLKVGR